jgi:IMP dehydrogenase
MIREGLTFDDVLLVPQHSEIGSRSDVDLSFKFSKPGFNTELANPIIPANMSTVTGWQMAEAVYKNRGLALVHRFMDPDEQITILTNMDAEYGRQVWMHVGLSVGVKPSDREIVDLFVSKGAEIICIDIAHGDSKQCMEMTNWISNKYPEVLLIAGNVATGEGARRLWKAGADIVKVGVGPGSLCTTRIETGNGVPQLSAIMDVAETQRQLRELERTHTYPHEKKRTFPFISDGGIKHVGDIVKALCFADLVMIGNMFAGCEETPGKIIVKDGISVKEYVGSSTHKANHIEGIAAFVPYKGKFDDILIKMTEGLQSGCSYQGVSNLTDLKDNPVFIRITSNGLKESHPHDVITK